MGDLFETAGMMPHGYCLLWQPWLVGLHASADLLVFLAYFLIPVAIWRFLKARPDVRLGGLEHLFAAFILLCGLSHLAGLATLWVPIYEVQGLIKALTAVVSAATVAVLFPMLPRLIALPSPTELREANADLEAEIASHRRTLAELEAVRDRLESDVAARTAELTEANAHLKVVLHETAHRTKNLLTVVQSIARQSAAFADTKDELVDALSGRMASLARALNSVIESDSGNAEMRDVIETQIAPKRETFPGRIEIVGPAVPVRAEAAQQIGLAIHELGTNAVKHGALARPGARVRIAWQTDGEAVELEWSEDAPEGGSAPGPAADGDGFGSLLLRRAVPMQLRAELDTGMTEGGYRYRLTIPMSSLRPRGGAGVDDVTRAFPLSGQLAPAG